MLNTSCICLISIVVVICIIGIIIWIVFGCLNKNKRYNNYRTFGGGAVTDEYTKFVKGCDRYIINIKDTGIRKNYEQNIIDFYKYHIDENHKEKALEAMSEKDDNGDHIISPKKTLDRSVGFKYIDLIVWFYYLLLYWVLTDPENKGYEEYFDDLSIDFKYEGIDDTTQAFSIQMSASALKKKYDSYKFEYTDLSFLLKEAKLINESFLTIDGKTIYDDDVVDSRCLDLIILIYSLNEIPEYFDIINKIFVLNESKDDLIDFDAILFHYFDFGIQEVENLKDLRRKLIAIARSILAFTAIKNNIQGDLNDIKDVEKKLDKANRQLETALKDADEAKIALEILEAKQQVKTAIKEVVEAQKTVVEVQKTVDKEFEKLQKAQNALEEANIELESLNAREVILEFKKAQKAVDNAQKAVDNAQKAVKDAKNDEEKKRAATKLQKDRVVLKEKENKLKTLKTAEDIREFNEVQETINNAQEFINDNDNYVKQRKALNALNEAENELKEKLDLLKNALKNVKKKMESEPLVNASADSDVANEYDNSTETENVSEGIKTIYNCDFDSDIYVEAKL